MNEYDVVITALAVSQVPSAAVHVSVVSKMKRANQSLSSSCNRMNDMFWEMADRNDRLVKENRQLRESK